MSKSWYLEVGIWLIGYVLICWPAFDLNVGVFSGADYSLLLTGTYGTLINAIIFYGNAEYLLPRFLRKRKVGLYVTLLFLGFLALSLIETFLDILGYIWFYGDPSFAIVEEVFYGQLLVHLFLFLIPSFIYRFSRDWIASSATSASEPSATQFLSVKSGNSVFQIPISKLEFIESDGNYIRYVYQDKRIMARDSLTNALEKLPDSFVRCHKSYIVSKDHIRRMDYDYIYLQNNELPIGRAYRTEVKNLFKTTEK